jgi:ECF sigma factor
MCFSPPPCLTKAHLRFAKQRDTDWQNRTYFFAVAVQAMRRILVDYARHANTARRGCALSLDSNVTWER